MKINHASPLSCAVCGFYACHNELPFCVDCLNELQKILTTTCRGCKKSPSACVCPENSELRFAFYYNGYFARRFIYMNKIHADPRIMDFWAELAVAASGVNPKSYDAVAFVPRAKKNRRRYGYDQSELFAKSLSKLYGIKLINVLECTGKKDQKLLSRAERYKNMVGRFRIREDFKKENTYNKILLVDDVCTTGATIKACADILRGDIARSVVPLVLAKTDSNNKRGEQK